VQAPAKIQKQQVIEYKKEGDGAKCAHRQRVKEFCRRNELQAQTDPSYARCMHICRYTCEISDTLD